MDNQRFSFSGARITGIRHNLYQGAIRSTVCFAVQDHEIEFEAEDLRKIEAIRIWDIQTQGTTVLLTEHHDFFKTGSESMTLKHHTLKVDRLRISTHCQYRDRYATPSRWIDGPITESVEKPKHIEAEPLKINRVRKLSLS